MAENSRREVVVTGLGIVSPVGVGVQAAWSALVAGTPGGARISSFEATNEYPSQIACEVKAFDPSGVLEAKEPVCPLSPLGRALRGAAFGRSPL